MKQTVKKDTNVNNYEFEFDAVFANETTHALFKKHQASEYNSENIEFVEAVIEFAKEPTQANAKKIIDTFICTGSRKELNINQQIRDTICTAELNANMFQVAYNAVVLGLKTEAFSRFIRSKLWLQFVEQASISLLNQVGIHKSNIHYFQLEPKDFESIAITPSLLQVAALLMKDFFFFSPITQSHISVFYANKQFLSAETINKYGNMNCLKITSSVFDIPAYKLMEALSTRSFFKEMGGILTFREVRRSCSLIYMQ